MALLFNIVVTFVVCYLLGCIPFALLVPRWFLGTKLSEFKEGGLGTLNVYETTKKKRIAALVMLLDAGKGVLATTFAYEVMFGMSLYIVIAALAVVLGHCFNIFLKFSGGRGLATALGAVITFNPIIILVWCVLWFLYWQIIKRDVLLANRVATILTPVLVFFAPARIFYHSYYFYYVEMNHYKVFALLLCGIIFAAHWKQNRIKVNSN